MHIDLTDKHKEWLVEFRSTAAELTAKLTMGRFQETVCEVTVDVLITIKVKNPTIKHFKKLKSLTI